MKRAIGFVLLLAACGGGDDDAATIDAPGASDAATDAPFDPAVVETRNVGIQVPSVAAGDEQTVCMVVDLGNTVPRMIRGVRSHLTPGTHHVIATLTQDAPSSPPSPCGPFAGGGADNGVLTIAQQSEAGLVYPAGAGVAVSAHQSVHLEMHYINTTDGPLTIGGTVDLDLADASTGLRPIDFLFTGNPSLSITAHGTATVTSFHQLEPGIELFATTAHTHQWGRRATVELANGASDPAARLLHDSTNWAERTLDAFTPIVITEGQGLRLTCNFENQSDADVHFGVSAEDEMCFVWAHSVAPSAP